MYAAWSSTRITELNALAARPTDGLFAYGGTGGKVRFYASGTSDGPGASDVACANPKTNVHSLAFNRQGTLLALGCEDGTVEVWSTSGWKRVDQWLAHKGKKIQALAFDRVGTVVASVGGEDEHHQTHAAQSGWHPQARSDERGQTIGT